MDEETRKRFEYEEQFYGMSSKFFVDSFKNFLKEELNSRVNLLVNNFRSKIIEQTEDIEKFELAVQNMRQTLIEEYNKSVDNTFKEYEKEISDILSIPSNVLLKEDLPILNGINGDIDGIKQEIYDLKQKFHSILYLKHQILEELEDADTAIIFMESFINDNNFNFNILPVEKVLKLSSENKLYIKNL